MSTSNIFSNLTYTIITFHWALNISGASKIIPVDENNLL